MTIPLPQGERPEPEGLGALPSPLLAPSAPSTPPSYVAGSLLGPLRWLPPPLPPPAAQTLSLKRHRLQCHPVSGGWHKRHSGWTRGPQFRSEPEMV